MKRFLLMVIALSLMIGFSHTAVAQAEIKTHEQKLRVGSSFFFGSIEQDNDYNNGWEPIEWIVLAIEDNKALLVSRYVLECLPYHTEKTSVVWEDSFIREWLNSEFLSYGFYEDEQEAILTTSLSNASSEGNPEWENPAGRNTEDRIFLLSYREVHKYIKGEEGKKLVGTELARSYGAKALFSNETYWWLRSPGKQTYDACYIDTNGKADTWQVSHDHGIRPALWIDLNVRREYFPYEFYQFAYSMYKDGFLDDAAYLFEQLGYYNDSIGFVREIRYPEAVALEKDSKFAEALELYNIMGDYKDSYIRGRECRYNLALEAEASGNYDKAIELFTEVGQYRDSMDRLKKCFTKKSIPIRYPSSYHANTGLDTGYQGDVLIDIKDPHFGWSLGNFFVSDFTRYEEDEYYETTFIKTAGNNLTLWFELNQDIDNLNGNSKLFIHEDENGYDGYFGIPKTNFGRGALLVGHRDFQSQYLDAVIYTDYLVANGTSGANTRIEIAEEGDYVIALNYEIKDESQFFNKYYNYYISVEFSVKNGNTMIFPFDIETGEELSNNARTENGFRLDLAQSHFLNINIKRTILTDGASNVRFNRPARDGEVFSEEGIYTITVSNPSTKTETTINIFIGDEDVYQEYLSNGLSMDALK